MPEITGGCLCGEFRYQTTAEPIRSGICHCRNCQRYTGSAYEPFIVFPSGPVTVVGAGKTFEHRGDSGRRVIRCFCPICGSGVMNIDPEDETASILAGTLDDPSVFQPTMEIFCDTELPWAHVDSDRKRFPGMPD